MSVTKIDDFYFSSTLNIDEFIKPNELSNIYSKNKLRSNEYIDQYLLEKIKKKRGKKCNNTGYIEDGIRIVERTIGKIHATHFTGNIHYNLKLDVSICIPLVGSVIECKVLGKNQVGIMCMVHPLQIMICNNLETSELINDNINPGDLIKVEILKYRIILNDKNIKVIGKIVE